MGKLAGKESKRAMLDLAERLNVKTVDGKKYEEVDQGDLLPSSLYTK